MRTALTAEAYQSIAERAWSHVLNGGGIVPTAAAVSLEDGIAAIAKDHFDAAAAEAEFEASLAPLDHQTRELIISFMWTVVSTYADAAFTYGAAVARQVQHGSAGKGVRA